MPSTSTKKDQAPERARVPNPKVDSQNPLQTLWKDTRPRGLLVRRLGW